MDSSLHCMQLTEASFGPPGLQMRAMMGREPLLRAGKEYVGEQRRTSRSHARGTTPCSSKGPLN